MAIEQWNQQSKQRVPAWAMSAVLHVLVIVMVALLWKNAAPEAKGAAEAERSGSIVIAVSNQGETEYFDESDATQTATSSPSSAAPMSAAEALPSLPEASLDLPDIQLPGAVQNTGGLPSELNGADTGMRGGAATPNQGDIDKALEQIRKQEAAQRGPPPVGTPAKLTVFGAPSVGRSFVFVIDRSKSMGGSGLGALVAAQGELRKGLSTLTPSQRFEVIVYNQSTDSYGKKFKGKRGLVKVTEGNIREVNNFFEGLVAFGSTEHTFGLQAALSLRPEVIYFLTDGGSPYLNASELKQIAGRARSMKCVINCVQFGFGPLQEQQNFMTALAEKTGGVFQYQRMGD